MFVAALSAPAQAGDFQKVWFAPMQPSQRPDGTQAGSMDYFGMFEPGAPWTRNPTARQAEKRDTNVIDMGFRLIPRCAEYYDILGCY